MASERLKLSPDQLPPPRTEGIHFRDVGPEAARALARQGVIVVKQVATEHELERVRTSVDRRLALALPLRLGRIAIDKAISQQEWAPEWARQDNLPHWLKRHATEVKLNTLAGRFTPTVQSVINRMQALNAALLAQPALHDKYHGGSYRFNMAVLNRTPAGMAFPRHQDDATRLSGLGAALQTEPTLWIITDDDTPDSAVRFTFETEPGDAVWLTERAGSSIPAREYREEHGEGAIYPGGSQVHSGLNLSDRTRHTLNLFFEDAA